MYNIQKKDLGKYDIAVCGGGIAGVCAAVSAAREGASSEPEDRRRQMKKNLLMKLVLAVTLFCIFLPMAVVLLWSVLPLP